MGYFLQTLILLSMVAAAGSLKVLIIPADYGYNSRLFTMGKMGKIIANGGHEVSFLVNSKVLEKYVPPPEVKVIKYDLVRGRTVRFITDEGVQKELNEIGKSFSGAFKLGTFWASIAVPFCEARLANNDKMKELKEADFDIIIVDILCYCCRILVDFLDKPSIVFSNYGFMVTLDILYPRMSSFMCDPMIPACLNDKINFNGRVLNFLLGGYMNYIVGPQLMKHMDDLRLKYNINASLKSDDSFKKSAVLVNTNFIFNYPRPMMPHVIPISGLFHKPSHPIDSDLFDLIEDPKYEHVVVVSFGTHTPHIEREKAIIMAEVFAQLPALVIWRYLGPDFEDLGSNIHLVGWFQQAAVLQHPKVHLFVTHCGISSTFEAIYNGIPVVTMPIQADQPYNAEALVGRLEVGRRIVFNDITRDRFSETVLDVFYNETFKKNAHNVKERLKHELVEPEKKLLYWVEHIARFGAPYLISDPVHELNIFQLYSWDVIGFLVLLVICFLGLLIFLVKSCINLIKWCMCNRKGDKKKEL